MTEEMLFFQMNLVRKMTLHSVSDVTEELADLIPAGSRNNIRWHLGHILVIQEFLMFRLTGEQLGLTDEYFRMFGRGTKPADWQTTAPDLESLRSLLDQQTSRIRETFSGRLSDAARKPFVFRDGVEFKTIGEILNFSLIHEGMHQGYINSFIRISEKTSV
ncbi:DinB family protein [Brevibacillus humidisoli]|uniref:DinB family protein n=1 Tax=Brevibacillus humidisoli TaxID=2895522 RepID=UPI001E55C3FB|nr:DinB family protein [Brevibacillus humidisoli]UFJ39844.1 DinB family protein [Brevibacillus humidisoli]